MAKPRGTRADTGSAWALSQDELKKKLATTDRGLSSSEAKERLHKYGHNEIADKDRRTWLDILIAQVASPLLLILMVALVISAFLGEVFDAIILLTIISISVILGFFQEYSSERALTALKKYFSYHATVIRNGEKMVIDARELVPGDIVTIGLGDIVPADIRLIETNGIEVNESALTGESREVEKNAKTVSLKNATPQDIKNGLFMGSVIVSGYAKGIVVATGHDTFFGKAAALFSAKVPESDFQLGIRKFGNLVFRVVIIITVCVFLSNYFLAHGTNPFADSLLFALALAVGIAPEALPAIITVTLSSGSLKLAEKKVVTKKLAAIEDLGNMDVLCTDKTGTLSEEAIRFERCIDFDMKDSHDVFEYAFLCNAAVGTLRIKGSSIDVAIRKKGLSNGGIDVSRFTKIEDIPFDYERRRMGVVVQEGRKRLLIAKGAPESMLSVCKKIKISSKLYSMREKGAYLKKLIREYNEKGYTTILVGYRDIEKKKVYSPDDERDLILTGFVLLFNPPKATVRATLERLGKLKVRLKILTGDDPLVTKKLCKDVGFMPSGGRIILGTELARMSDDKIRTIVERYDVFARVTPEQKLKIVEALRANGHVVGFLGDGINDAPALRTADVGISVDTAADVAKGASNIILLRKSLSVVADGIENGRKIFGNITKYILNTMSANNGNMITVAVSSLFLPFIPLLPTQILLNNLLSDMPLMSIASDNVDKEHTRRPQKWDINFIMKFMLFFGVISTIFDLLLIGILYLFMQVDIATFRTAWFLESVLSEMIIVFSLRTQLPFFRSMPSALLVGASLFAIIVSILAIYFGPLAILFHFVPLSGAILLLIAVILAAYFALTEIGKPFFYAYIARAAATSKLSKNA
jgi:Mg2+-importing ATPase